jgi:general secretion pathway protein D
MKPATPPKRALRPGPAPGWLMTLSMALALAAAALLLPAQAADRKPAPGSNAKSRAPVTVNFVNADIEAVTRAFAAMIERQIAVDPRVRGAITVYSEQPQSIPEAYQSFLSALRGLGFAVVESGGLLKVVPEADAKLQTGTVSVGTVGVKGDQIITQIFQLRYENPNNLVAVLRPLISANNTINANPASSSLVITDYADNLRRIAQIIAALDQPAVTDIEVIPMQYAVAADLLPLVQRLADAGAGAAVPGAAGGGGAVTVIADARSNSLIVRAPNAARLATVRNTIARLDRPSSGIGPGGGLWVVHLKNADAVKLATVLRAAFSPTGGGGGGGGGGSTSSPSPAPTAAALQPGAAGASAAATAPISGSPQPSTGGFIQADPTTNSLIITAPEPLYRQVRTMIDQLDNRRAQVYIESMIVEVSGDNAADFGFQWQGLLGNRGDSTGFIGGTNFTPPGGAGNIIGVSTGVAQGTIALGEGINLGILRNYGGTYALAALARMLQSQTNTNIVSTPNLITLDNEEAKIVVGSNVPFVTGSFSNTGATGGGSVNPFQTIERRDVGITLRIRPQIGEGGTVRMAIYQEVSTIIDKVAPGTTNAGPSTNKRLIESNVVVDDGGIIVIGGLIEDRFVDNKSQVPLLGDIPWIGALFRSQSRTKTRTNLMVFLRPVVLRDAASADKLSLDRYDLIRSQQQETQPARSIVMPINEAPVLPPMREGLPIPTLPVTPIRGVLPVPVDPADPAASGAVPTAPPATPPATPTPSPAPASAPN